jgi:trigger factor
LTGVRPDDTRNFTIKYPEDFSARGLAGKEIEYTASVKAVGRKETPEPSDEWAHSVSEEVETLDALRERVRGSLTDRARNESDYRLRADIMRALISAHQFEVPETLINFQAKQLMESAVRDMIGRGLDPRNQELNWDALRKSVAAQAVDDLRGSMLLEQVAEQEEIEVSDEEINAEIEALAEASRQTPDAVRDALTKQGGDRSIADRLRNRKALDLLVENARITDEEWRDDDEEAMSAETIETAETDAPDNETNAATAAADDTAV